MRTCTKCGLQKPQAAFYQHTGGGLYTQCKDCHKAAVAARRDREKAKLAMRNRRKTRKSDPKFLKDRERVRRFPNSLPEVLQLSFWDKVDKSAGEDACWPWTSSTDDSGYGKWSVSAYDLTLKAHRVAYGISKGPLLDGMEIDHSCRTLTCCNPKHLHQVPKPVNGSRNRLSPEEHRAIPEDTGFEYASDAFLETMPRILDEVFRKIQEG